MDGSAREAILLQIVENPLGPEYRFYFEEPLFSTMTDIPDIGRDYLHHYECGIIVSENQLEFVIDEILNYPIHNKGDEWNCQSWVLECLDLLRSQMLLLQSERKVAQLKLAKE